MNRLQIIFFLFLGISFSFSGCYYDDEETLYALINPPACDTTNVTYTNDIIPILERECYTCHGSSAPGGGYILNTYTGLSVSVNDGSLLGAVAHETGFSNMPKGGNQLLDCDIQFIRTWINQGALNN